MLSKTLILILEQEFHQIDDSKEMILRKIPLRNQTEPSSLVLHRVFQLNCQSKSGVCQLVQDFTFRKTQLLILQTKSWLSNDRLFEKIVLILIYVGYETVFPRNFKPIFLVNFSIETFTSRELECCLHQIP